nr:RNA-directed DNA polymerase, eukaryota, reverse transcriptase zinc-binding domain protein [Tanacetum cinerariifolium]
SEEFKIIFRGKVFWIRAKETPGWVPDILEEVKDEDQSDVDSKDGSNGASMHVEEGRGGNSENENEGNVDMDNAVPSGNHSGMNSKEGGTESVCSGHFKKSEVPRTGLIQKAKKDWVKELCVKNKVNFLALQETKMENMKLFCVKTCWGNMAFDYVHSDSVGFSKIVEDAWKESPSDESNAMIPQCMADLEAVEVIIDSGNRNEEIAIKIMELVKNLQHIDKLNSLEIAQKAKVKWAIEG